ncbi:MAG: hypothetical protein Q7J04_04840, partial [Microcella sp.]|nr:hypothetical protein [Microcella sp.]
AGSPLTDDQQTVAIVPGLLIGDRWFAFDFTGDSDDADDGFISTGDSAIGTLVIETDGSGNGSRTFSYPEFDTLLGDDIPFEALNFFTGLFPSAWVAVCSETDAISSRVDVRPGRERLEATLAFDPDEQGALIGSGFFDAQQVLPLLAPLQSGLSPADSLWLALLGGLEGDLDDFLFELDVDPETGAATGVHGFGDLPPGQYALGTVAFVGEIQFADDAGPASVSDALRGDLRGLLESMPVIVQQAPFTIPKAEWVLTVRPDGVLILAKADGTQESRYPAADDAELADTGSVEPIMAFALAVLAVLMGAAIAGAVRRRPTTD